MKTKYDALEELATKATPGPWLYDGSSLNNWQDGEMSMEWISNLHDSPPEDGHFIAAARNAVPDLIADVKALAEALTDATRNDELEICMRLIERNRPQGANGIGVDKDEHALAWQRASLESGRILERRRAALSRIQEPK